MIKKLFLASSFIFILTGVSFSRPSGSTLSAPIFLDEGSHLVPWAVIVGSITPVKQPYFPDTLMDRATLIENGNSSVLLISTISSFTSDDVWFYIPGNSSLSLSAASTFYMLYPPGVTTDTVHGCIAKQ